MLDLAEKRAGKLSPGANVIKHFAVVSYEFCKKLERLSLASLSSLV
jgi:hypothetical protein